MAIGFRIYTKVDKPDKSLVEQFKEFPTNYIADCINRINVMRSNIKSMVKPGINMVGVALTVKARTGDNLMVHKACNMSQEGDVIVVSNEGRGDRALIGEIMVRYCKYKNIAGLVLDAPIRDSTEIYEIGLPVFATGTTPAGPYKEGPGEINVPISCGGVCVNPGDIIIGDDDGIVVIPKADAEYVLDQVKELSKIDKSKVLAAASGTIDRSWIDKKLIEKGCEFI